MKLLSRGDGPGSHGGRVKDVVVFSEVRVVALEKETLERPFSMLIVVRVEHFVRSWLGERRKDSIVEVGVVCSEV